MKRKSKNILLGISIFLLSVGALLGLGYTINHYSNDNYNNENSVLNTVDISLKNIKDADGVYHIVSMIKGVEDEVSDEDIEESKMLITRTSDDTKYEYLLNTCVTFRYISSYKADKPVFVFVSNNSLACDLLSICSFAPIESGDYLFTYQLTIKDLEDPILLTKTFSLEV